MTTELRMLVDEIAEHLSIKRDFIYRSIDRKGLPAYCVGQLWKFQVFEVDGWVRAGGADEEHRSDGQTPSYKA